MSLTRRKERTARGCVRVATSGRRVPVLIGIMLLSFILVQSMPGDPLRMLIPPELLAGNEDFIETQRRRYGLDDPLIVQFVNWGKEVLQGNLGYSFHLSKPVREVLGGRIVPSLVLMGGSMLLALAVAVPVGLLCRAAAQQVVRLRGLGPRHVGHRDPELLHVAARDLRVRRQAAMAAGRRDGSSTASSTTSSHAVLPIVVLAAALFGLYMRYTRQAALEVLNEPYITAARALRRVALQGGVQTRAEERSRSRSRPSRSCRSRCSSSGAIVAETMFAWPGDRAGSCSTSITTRDYPVIIGFTLIVAVIVVISQLLLDLVIAWLDPRVRLGGGAVSER